MPRRLVAILMYHIIAILKVTTDFCLCTPTLIPLQLNLSLEIVENSMHR